MTPEQTILARKNIDKRLAPLREHDFALPPRGWVKAVRESLGLTTRQLALRMGVAQSRVTAIEKAEAYGTITLRTLRAAAEAMNCALVYAIVPTSSLDAIVRTQATERVGSELARIHHSMRLENQALTQADLAAERERLVKELLAGPPRRVWDDE